MTQKLSKSEDRSQSDFFKHIWNTYPHLRQLLFHIPNGGKRNPREANKLKAMGVVPGVADLFFSVPAWTYKGLYIEMKEAKGYQTPEQIKFMDKVRACGYAYAVCRSSDEAVQAFEQYHTMIEKNLLEALKTLFD